MNFLPKLSSFEGPLDLLLHLIEKNEIDIYDIPIAEITDQFIEYLDSGEDEDTEFLSEFIVMAAQLLDIKARMLVPRQEAAADEEDPRQQLVAQLLEYKLFKHMSAQLKDREVSGGRYLYRDPSVPQELSGHIQQPDYDVLLACVSAESLCAAFNEAMARYSLSRNEEARRFGKIKKDAVSLPARMDEIRTFMKKNPETSFLRLVGKSPAKENIIVTFLAVLELMKAAEIFAYQKGEDIVLKLNVS